METGTESRDLRQKLDQLQSEYDELYGFLETLYRERCVREQTMAQSLTQAITAQHPERLARARTLRALEETLFFDRMRLTEAREAVAGVVSRLTNLTDACKPGKWDAAGRAQIAAERKALARVIDLLSACLVLGETHGGAGRVVTHDTVVLPPAPPQLK